MKENDMKEKLQELLEVINEAVEIAKDDVQGGEYHMQPVYAALTAASSTVARRIYQVEDSERELEAHAAAEAKTKADAEEATRKKAERAKFEAEAIAKADEEKKAEAVRAANYEAARSSEARKRYSKKDQDDLLAIASKRNVAHEPGIKKSKLVNLLLQSDGLVVTQADQEAADKE